MNIDGASSKIRAMRATDREDVAEALVECGAFTDEEVRVALEMVDAGLEGDYSLPSVEVAGRVSAYACIGKAPLTAASWYIYWICVHPAVQGAGIGRLLEAYIEEFVRAAGGDRLVVETSSMPAYERARRFYERAGFSLTGRIPDFYKPHDDCIVLFKKLSQGPAAALR